MKNTRNRQSLTFIFLLLPVLLLAVYSFFQTRNQLIRHVYEERKELATISAKMLHEKLDRLSEIGRSFTTWPSFRQSFEDGKWQHAISMMNSITNDFPYISNVFITDTAGKVMADYIRLGGTKTDQRNFSKWHDGVKEKWQPYLSEVYNYPDNPGQITSALAIPLNNMAGKLAGVLVLEVNINKLLEWSNDIDVGKNGFVYIVDQIGNIAINPNYKQSAAVINYSSVPAVQKALQGKKDVEILYNPVTKEKSLCAYEQVPVYGWAVVVQEEAGAALSVNHSIRTVLIFYIFFLLLAIGFIWIILRGLIRQRKTEQDLKKSDDNIHLLVDNVKDYAILMLDKNGLVTNWNQGAEQIKGYTAGEILGHSLDQFYTAADIEKGLPAQNLAMARQQGHIESEGWRVRKDGSLFWANMVITALRDENGDLYGYSKITRDTTERKKTQEQLELLSQQINQSHEAIYTTDSNRRIKSWNKGAENLYGYTKEELVGKDLNTILQTAISEPEMNFWIQSIAKEGHITFELKRKKKSGEDIWVHVSTTTIKDENDTITGYISVNLDITERKKLMAKVNHLASMVEQSSEAIISRGLDRSLISWNRGAEILLGYSKEEVLGKTAVELGIVKFEPEEKAAVEKELAETGSWKSERLFYHKNGSSFYGLVTANSVKSEQGEMTSQVFIIKDISLRKQLEERLKATNDDLEQKVKERTEQIYRSEKQYRYLFENNPLPMWVLEEASFKFLDVNERAIRHYGYSREEFLSMTAFDIRPASEQSLLRQEHFETETGPGCKNRGVWIHLKKDGSRMQVEIIAHAINFENKKARLILANDVTEKIKAEEELGASEKRFRTLIENSNDVITLMDDSFRLIYRSPAAERITGWSNEDMLNVDATRNIHPDDLEEARAVVKEVMTNPGKQVHTIFRNLHKAGHYIWMEGVLTNWLHDESINAIVFNYYDVTERVEAADKLAASELRYRSLIENSAEGISLMSEKGDVIYRSPSGEKLLGHGSKEGVINFAHPDNLDMFKNKFAEALGKPGLPVDYRVKYRHPDGHYFIAEGTFTNLLNVKGVNAVVANYHDVTERIAAEEKLLASEKRFRALIEKNYDVINLVDESLNVIYRSPSAQRVTGLTDEDILHKSIESSVHPDETEMVTALIKETFANPGKPIPCKIRSRHKDGHYLWLEGMITNLLHNEFVKAVLLNFRDVTERVEADEKLKEQKAQLQTLGDNLTGVMIYQLIGNVDGSRQFTYVSNGVSRLTGKTPEEVMNDPAILYNMILEEDKPGFLSAEAEAGRQLSVFSREVRCRTYNNEIRWLNIVSTPRKQLNGQVVWDGFHIDITEQKEAAKKIADREARFRTLIENNTDAIVLNDADSNILYQSPSVSKILGYELEERKNKKSLDYVHPESREAFIQLYQQLKITPNQPLPFQYRFLHKSGSYVWLEGVVTNLLDDPKVNAYVANYRDITERKEADEKIKNLNENLEIKIHQRTEQLKKSNEELEAFSYSVSHDLRAPLRGIIGFTSILEEEYSSKLDDEAKRITGIIKSNTLKMGNLIDDLLSFSRVGRHEIEKILLNNNEIVQQVIGSIEQKTDRVIDWVLPSLHTAYGDANTIRQVWVNLISNAVKYSSGNNSQRIEIGSYVVNDMVVYFVKDNGVGFDEKYADKLFKVFQRLHSSSEFEGTGVGLAIVEKIVSKHGGRVWAAAEKGKGATFYFSLPVDNNFSI